MPIRTILAISATDQPGTAKSLHPAIGSRPRWLFGLEDVKPQAFSEEHILRSGNLVRDVVVSLRLSGSYTPIQITLQQQEETEGSLSCVSIAHPVVCTSSILVWCGLPPNATGNVHGTPRSTAAPARILRLSLPPCTPRSDIPGGQSLRSSV